MPNTQAKPKTQVRLSDGTTTCCNAYTKISIDDHVEFCRACYEEVEGYLDDIPSKK